MPSGAFQGAIFDVDGVLVDSPHEQAWRESLRELMEGEWADIRDQTEWTAARFTSRVYEQLMSGKPRKSGALAALKYFKVPDADHRVKAYSDHKQSMLITLIEAGEFTAFPDALQFALAVKGAGIPVAAASSSKNAHLFLSAIRVDHFAAQAGLRFDFVTPGLTLHAFFDADVSGRDFKHGKPDPEIFLTAAEELGVAPEGCFVVEDAESGIQAAKAGRMAALGIARRDDQLALEAVGADLVVTSLEHVDVERLSHGELAKRPTSVR